MSASPQMIPVRLVTLESLPDMQAIEVGEMVSVSVVQASNIIRDVREMITNTFGGRMRRYEVLLDVAKDRALDRFREELAEQGYAGALGVRIAHPNIIDGAVELIVYGTGFRYR